MSLLGKTEAPTNVLVPARGRRRLATLVGAAVTAGLFAVAVAVASSPDSEEARPSTAPADAAPLAPSDPALAEDPFTGNAMELRLPQPTGFVDGIPSGFPESEAGAVAAAYGYSRIASGLDVATTLRTLQRIADPSSTWFARSRSEIADGLVAQRTSLGLPPTGSAGSALVTVTPAAYRVVAFENERAEVLTLNQVSAQAVDGRLISGTVVFRWSLAWVGSQWRATDRFTDPKDDSLASVPYTSDAVAKGWKEASGG